jgi:hypothetical protein
MKLKLVLLLLLFFLLVVGVFAQTDTGSAPTDTGKKTTDTSTPKPKPTPKPPVIKTVIVDSASLVVDTTKPVIDTSGKDTLIVVASPPAIIDTTSYKQYFRHPYLSFDKAAVFMLMKERLPESKDTVFYLLAGLLFFVAVTRLLFPKYFHSTFRLFFQSSFRQKQTKEQLGQQALGSLLLNLLFFISGAIYITLVVQHYNWNIFSFWKLLLYSSIALAVLYIGKFLFLSFAGWVFNAKEGSDTYIFIVFLINKIIGVMLIPFALVIAFADASIADAAIISSLILLALLFFYRYFVSLKSFRRDLNINPLHFFLYLCGVEIAPLLIIAKVIFNYVDGRF